MSKKKQKRNWLTVVIIILLLVGAAVMLFGLQFKKVVEKEKVSFKELLSAKCKAQGNNLEHPKEFEVSDLPFTLPIDDLTREKAICGSYDSYVFIPLGNEEFSGYESKRFITISDSDSQHCCEAPSDIEPTGKKITSVHGVDIYIHVGHFSEGPDSRYKPIFIRGIRQTELPTKEKIRLIMDRIAISEEDTSLQELEDRYKVLDTYFESGKYLLTPKVVKEMLNDNFFDDIQDSSVVKKVISELNSISAK